MRRASLVCLSMPIDRELLHQKAASPPMLMARTFLRSADKQRETRMRPVVLCVAAALVGATLVGRAQAAGGASEPHPILSRIASRLHPVFHRHYPGTKAQIDSDRVVFEHGTRVFLIHVPLKTGEWQKAREVKGPDRNGILCTIQLRDGRYDGAAVLPQTFNERYFETTVAQEPSPDGSRYLYVHLSYPSGVRAGFQKEFWEVVRTAWSTPRQ